jgi:hypothetical protein
MRCLHFVPASLAISALVVIALAAPPASAQAPRPGQTPPPAGQRGPAPPPSAAQKQAPPKPYKVIPVTLAQPSNDQSFEAFRKQLADIAKRKDRAALTKIVVASNFFWMGEKGDKADKRKNGINNLAAAIGLDAQDGSGWETLADAAEEATLEPIPQKRGVMCSPASPKFDEAAADQVAKETGTEPGDWGYPTKAGVEVRSAGQPNAQVIDKLGLNLVRVMPEEPAGGAPPQESEFVRIVTPAGKVGFVVSDALASLDSDQLCYIKDATGWKIAGYAGGE